jgi:hypothetical protein
MPPASFSQRSDPQRTDRDSRASEILEGVFRSPGLILRVNGSTKCGRYLLRSSLAAALLSGLFDHPARVGSSCPQRAGH